MFFFIIIILCVLFRKHLKELVHNNPLQQIQTNGWTVHATSTITEPQGNVLWSSCHTSRASRQSLRLLWLQSILSNKNLKAESGLLNLHCDQENSIDRIILINSSMASIWNIPFRSRVTKSWPIVTEVANMPSSPDSPGLVCGPQKSTPYNSFPLQEQFNSS